MKLNKILMVLAATAIVGCTTDDVSDFTANQANDDSRLVQLDPNFVLAGVGDEGNITRTHWDVVGGAVKNVFLPIYAVNATGLTLDVAADLNRQAVGLCWLGQVPGTDVYTNYQFYHFGWLNNGAKKAEFECDKLTNGSLYSEIGNTADLTLGVANALAAGNAGDEADPTVDFVGAIPAKSTTAGLNYNSGIYKTDNKAIFGGDYIVYYPFNAEFKNAGTIPAAAVTTFADVATVVGDPQLGEQTFRYSGKVNIEGGAQASDFGLKNLSTLVQLKLITKNTDVAGDVIDQIVLYSAKEQLLKEAHLAADKIVAGEEGTKLYVEEESKGTKTITANSVAGIALNATKDKWSNAFITVLPTTVEDLVVLVHNKTTKKWARINLPGTQFKAGAAQILDLPLEASAFKADFIAVDEASLINARNEARAAGGAKTITVIGDITLDGTTADALNTYNFNTPADRNITIKGNDIIIPEDITFNTTANIESNVRVLGKSCCSGTNGAILNVDGGTLNNVTIEPTEANATTKALYDQYNPEVNFNGNATIAAGKKFDVQAGNVNVYAAVQHKGDLNIAEDVTLTVKELPTAGDLNFMGGTVVNDGTIKVEKNAKFDMTDKNGNATATDGERMTNNGKFIHNVDAGVGTAVQKMHQNGEYRCRVDDQVKLDDAFLQWTASSVIEIVGAGTYNLGTGKGVSYKHNNEFIDFEVNAAVTFDNTVDGSKGDKENIQVRNLTVTTGSLDVDLKGTVAPNNLRTLTVWGDMVVKANTTFTNSQLLDLKKNLTVENGSTLFYKGKKANVDGLKVAKDIKVSGATFDAGLLAADVDAINITCANFTLEKTATAIFGNRTDGGAKNMVVSGTITNPSGCIFNIVGANQDGNGSVLAWISCKALIAQGTFPGSKPRVE